MNSTNIETIRPIEQVDGGFTFVAVLQTDKGSREVPVDAAALQSYGAFRKAVVEKSGIWFQAHEFEGRRGAKFWSEEIGMKLEAAK